MGDAEGEHEATAFLDDTGLRRCECESEIWASCSDTRPAHAHDTSWSNIDRTYTQPGLLRSFVPLYTRNQARDQTGHFRSIPVLGPQLASGDPRRLPGPLPHARGSIWGPVWVSSRRTGGSSGGVRHISSSTTNLRSRSSSLERPFDACSDSGRN